MKGIIGIPAILTLGLISAGAACGQNTPAQLVAVHTMRDPSGAMLGASSTTNSSFPVTPGAYQTTFASVVACPGGPTDHYAPVLCSHGLLAKYSPAGESMIWATFLGGATGGEVITSAALDPQNNVWVAGSTSSTDFPVTSDALHKTPGNYFLSELSSDGSQLLYSTFLNLPVSFLSTSGGALYLAGLTGGQPFSGTPGAYRTTPDPGANEIYVIKLDPVAGQAMWATLVGPADLLNKFVSGTDGTVYIAGTTSNSAFPVTQGVYSHPSQVRDIFVTAIKPDGSDLAFSTVIGGSGGPTVQDMARDDAGNIYVAAAAGSSLFPGNPISPDLPVTSDAAQPFWGGAYLMKLAPGASALLYASYMGKDSLTNYLLSPGVAAKIQVGPDGKLHMLWSSEDADIPLSPAGFGPCFPNLDLGYRGSGEYVPGYWAYVRLTSDLKTVDYATAGVVAASGTPEPGPFYFDTSGNFYLTGNATSYFTILNMSQAPHSGPACIAEYVTKRQSEVAPGLLVSIYGPGIGPLQPTGAVLDRAGNVASQLAGAQVFFDRIPAPILYAEPSHIDAVVPFGVGTSGNTTISVLQDGTPLGTLTAALQPQLIRVFSVDGTGYGAAFWNQDGTPNSPANPAQAGDILTLYMTGAGQMSPQAVDGAIPSAPASAPQTALSIGGTICPVVYAGDAPGQVEGIVQINCQLEKTTTSGPRIGAQTVWVQSAHDSAPEGWNSVFSK